MVLGRLPETSARTSDGNGAATGRRRAAGDRRRAAPADPQQAKLVADDEDAIADLADDGLSLAGFLGLSDTPRAEAPACSRRWPSERSASG